MGLTISYKGIMSNDNSTKSNIRKVIAAAVLVLLLIGVAYFFLRPIEPAANSNDSTENSAVESISAPESSIVSETQPTQSASEKSSQISQPEQSEPQSSSSRSLESSQPEQSEPQTVTLRFRSESLLNQHYRKHGIDMGFSCAEDYEKAAAAVPSNPAALHKTEKEDGDDVYYIESTNEFVVVSTDGYIRTYFLPDAGRDYFERQ